LKRAAELAEESPERVPAEERAQLWFQQGLFYEDGYLDTRHLVWAPDVPVQSPECGIAGTFCLNFTQPRDFNAYFKSATDLSEYGEDDFEGMVDAFRRALEADPTHDGALRRLSIHLIDRGDLAEAERLARRYRANVPDSPWGYITLGLVYQRSGRDSLAGIEFDRGLELAPPGIVAHYRDISPLLRASLAEDYLQEADAGRRNMEEVLWRKSDPLYLTPGNEVRVAHLARVAYADLMFEDPSEGVWGAETEQGVVYVRYGPPQRIWQLHRDATREESGEEAMNAVEAAVFNQPSDPLWYTTRQMSSQGGGRWVFWNYGWGLPNFIFQKQLRARHASHLFSSYSKTLEEEARRAVPAVYSTSFDILGYPAQLARFRGVADSIIELDLYSEVPADELLAGPDDVDVGLFVFTGVEHVQIYDRKLRITSAPEPQPLTYSVSLLGGRYSYSLEARGPSGKAALRREGVELKPYLDSELALSDLVLASTVVPRVEKPTDRGDFAIKVNRRLEFEPDDPLAVYWEVYGLTTDDEGLANYQVTLSVTDTRGRSVLATVVGVIGQLLGLSEQEGPQLTYERIVEFTDDRVPEYLSLQLADDEPGEYRLRIEVTDQLSGNTVVRERAFQVIGS
jgi:GWxTD domain-containing protein